MAFGWNNADGINNVPPYEHGAAWFQGVSGQGRDTDFASPWKYGTGDMGFLIRYCN